jgi:hypothetical protein
MKITALEIYHYAHFIDAKHFYTLLEGHQNNNDN